LARDAAEQQAHGDATSLDPAERERIGEVLSASLHAPLQPLEATVLSGGRSNLTYQLTDGRDSWVLRRPPLGHVLETAHDMRREFRVIKALRDTRVPVPDAIVYCDDTEVIGSDFYIMSLVPGRVFRTDADLSHLSVNEATALSNAFIDTLADLHSVDYRNAGLADLGRPDGYLQRQLARWNKQLNNSHSRDIAGFPRLAEMLNHTIPASRYTSIVHGDFRLDNAIVDQIDPSRVRAILDWEMATLGDPLSDLGLFYLYWQGWGGLDNPIAATPAEVPGFPSWADLAERYSARTGTELTSFAWYQGFALFKFAVICEGIHYRYVSGMTVGAGFDKIGAMVPELVRRGLAALPR
jgi:aminoglycoside phosphotransferase (APT) family kinase protein